MIITAQKDIVIFICEQNLQGSQLEILAEYICFKHLMLGLHELLTK